MMANVKITTIKANKEKCVSFLELNKKDLGMVKESLGSAIEFLDRALIESWCVFDLKIKNIYQNGHLRIKD